MKLDSDSMLVIWWKCLTMLTKYSAVVKAKLAEKALHWFYHLHCQTGHKGTGECERNGAHLSFITSSPDNDWNSKNWTKLCLTEGLHVRVALYCSQMQICKEINKAANILAEFIQDTAGDVCVHVHECVCIRRQWEGERGTARERPCHILSTFSFCLFTVFHKLFESINSILLIC